MKRHQYSLSSLIHRDAVPLTAKEANKDATVTNNDHDITHITHVLKSESIRLLILPRPLS